VKAVDEAVVRRLADHWEQGWNDMDVDVIMAPFADDVVFGSPFVTRVTGDESVATIEGHGALRAYVVDALERTPGIRYTLHAAYAGPDTVVLVYTVHRPDGTDTPGADYMKLDDAGKVVDWRSHYAFDFIRAT
jgi:SnoaL-like domain